MSECIRKKLCIRGTSHIALHVSYAYDLVNECNTVQDIIELVNDMQERITSLVTEFKLNMSDVGYKWVEFYEINGKLNPLVHFWDDGSIHATSSGDLHQPFAEAVVKSVCDKLGMELEIVQGSK